MPTNGNLNSANLNENDEFYTLKKEIEKEVSYYKKHFKNKIVYCNCDEYTKSNFWNFFYEHFEEYGLKKLMCTYFKNEGEVYLYEYDGSTISKIPLEGNGDYASEECLKILDTADIVVTNPPFSLLKDFVPTVLEHGKKILTVCTNQCITYRKVFPYVRDNKLWPGVFYNKNMEFIMPDNYQLIGKAFIDEDGRKHGFVSAICWLTNLEHDYMHRAKEKTAIYDEEKNPHYDNYDAIEVSKTKDILCDYYETMGVPITFMTEYDADVYELLDMFAPNLNGKTIFKRLMIRRKR